MIDHIFDLAFSFHEVATLKSRALHNIYRSFAVAPYESSNYLEEPSPTTSKFIMQQTMLRVKDPRESLKWYSNVLGMRLLQELHFPEYKFSLYFMGYCNPSDIPTVIIYFIKIVPLE